MMMDPAVLDDLEGVPAGVELEYVAGLVGSVGNDFSAALVVADRRTRALFIGHDHGCLCCYAPFEGVPFEAFRWVTDLRDVIEGAELLDGVEPGRRGVFVGRVALWAMGRRPDA